MWTVFYSVKEAALSALGFPPRGGPVKNLLVNSLNGVDLSLQKHQLYSTRELPRHSAALQSLTTSSPELLTRHMERVPSMGDASPCLVKSQTGSITSLTLSDSEEESGYMSCTSGGKKARYSKDIENLLANHSDSSKSLNSSLNDVSSCEPNDSREHSQDDDVDDGDKTHQYVNPYISTSNVILTKVTSLDTPTSPEPQLPEEQLEEEESEDESSDDDKDAGLNQKAEEAGSDADEEEEEEEKENSEGEEDEEEDEEESRMRKPLQRQTTVISQKEDDDETTSCEEDEDKVVEFPEKKKKHKSRKNSSSSSGTWVSDNDEKCVGVGVTGKDDDDSDGPDIGDFFDTMADNVSYKFFEEDSAEVSSYPSHEFFTHGRSSPVFGPETMITQEADDDDDDFGYIYSSDLKTGKRYAFPRREPRTISDAVDFWETDFEVKGAIYPCMASWEEKCLVPTYEEDAEDHLKYIMYKSLYDKWVKCNKSSEQWSQRYWGRSIEFVARMKGAPKPPMVTDQSDSPVDDLPELCTVDHSVADRRRRRRNDAVSVTRGMY